MFPLKFEKKYLNSIWQIYGDFSVVFFFSPTQRSSCDLWVRGCPLQFQIWALASSVSLPPKEICVQKSSKNAKFEVLSDFEFLEASGVAQAGRWMDGVSQRYLLVFRWRKLRNSKKIFFQKNAKILKILSWTWEGKSDW